MRATLKGGKDHGTQEEHKKKSLDKTKYLALQKNMGKESRGCLVHVFENMCFVI